MYPRYLLPVFLPVIFFLRFPPTLHSAEPTPPPGEKSATGKVEKALSKESPDHVAAFARRLWAITDLVLTHHIEPPSRQEMFLAGARELLKTGDVSAPSHLGRRISKLTTPEQFTALVEEIWSQARSSTTASSEQLVTAMIQGLLRPVPGNAESKSVKEYQAQEKFRMENHSTYVGTGIMIDENEKENRVQIIQISPGGPARRAGAKLGDLIIKVNGVDVYKATVEKVTELVHGRPDRKGMVGHPVTMVVRQPNSTKERTLKMEEEVIASPTVKGYRRESEDNWIFRMDPNVPIAYLRFETFKVRTLHELRKIEQHLQHEGVRALVLDLRSNSAQDSELYNLALVAGGLLDGGVMWRVRDAHNQVKEYRADRNCLFRDWPLAVLVDEMTQQPESNTLISALQDNGRATIVGERTLGLAHYVKSFVKLPDGQDGVWLRTGIVERPDPALAPKGPENKWQQIQPDHPVKMDYRKKQAIHKWLSNKGYKWYDPEEPQAAGNDDDKAPEDPQLAKAIELLRTALKNQSPTQKPPYPGRN